MKKGAARQKIISFFLIPGIFIIAGCGMWNTSSSGTTSNTNAGTKPTVTLTIPASNASGVLINAKVAATFSRVMNPSTLTSPMTTFTLKQGATTVPGTVSYSGLTAVFTPTSNLAASTTYTATVTTGAMDTLSPANGLAANYTWSFKTGAALDTVKPTVISTIPISNASGVLINSKISATFSKAMDPLSLTTSTFTLKQGATTIPGVVTTVGMISTFAPTTNLAPNTTYTATITTGAADLAVPANTLATNYTWSFTTGATTASTAPTVILVNPSDLSINVPTNSAVNATFSEAMDPATMTTANFMVQASGPPLGSPLAGPVTYDLLSHIATLTPTSPLASNTHYTAMITTGAKDLFGNSLAVNKVWTFTTGSSTVLAPGAIDLGSAATFGIMATSAITNTGNSVINGDVSLDPGTSMTGFPPGVVNGSIHINDTVSALARQDLLTAYNQAKGLPPGVTISGGADLGALYPGGIPPGTYTSGSTMLVSTPLVLDAGGNTNAVWVFQIGSSLTTGANVTLANGAQSKNVFWVPTSDTTIGVGTIFDGTIVAGRDATGVTGATINGRILAGAITAGTIALQGNTVNVPAP